jgi:hypothetical protein
VHFSQWGSQVVAIPKKVPAALQGALRPLGLGLAERRTALALDGHLLLALAAMPVQGVESAACLLARVWRATNPVRWSDSLGMTFRLA